MWSRTQLIGAGVAIAALLLIWGAWDARHHAPPPVVTERTVQETRLEATTEAVRTLEAQLSQVLEQNRVLAQQAAESQRQAATVNTQTREVIYRGEGDAVARLLAAQSAKAPAPAVVVVPGVPPSPGVATPPAVSGAPAAPAAVEVVVRDTRTEDRTVTERQATTNTQVAETAQGTTTATLQGTSREESRAEVTARAETSRTETPAAAKAADPEGGRVGVGFTATAHPFASVDLAKLPLGPRFLHLGKLNAGLFAEFKRPGEDGTLLRDAGPQVNYQKRRLFGMVGYGVKRSEVKLGVGFKF